MIEHYYTRPSQEHVLTLCMLYILVFSVDYNDELDILVSGSADFTVKVWALSAGTCLNTLTGHTEWVTKVGRPPEEILTSIRLCRGEGTGGGVDDARCSLVSSRGAIRCNRCTHSACWPATVTSQIKDTW